jgi:hypothetical protein
MDAAAHASVAKQELHWWHEPSAAWLCYSSKDRAWTGWSGVACTAIRLEDEPSVITMWQTDLDSSSAPFFRWFKEGQTNACFNEVLISFAFVIPLDIFVLVSRLCRLIAMFYLEEAARSL